MAGPLPVGEVDSLGFDVNMADVGELVADERLEAVDLCAEQHRVQLVDRQKEPGYVQARVHGETRVGARGI